MRDSVAEARFSLIFEGRDLPVEKITESLSIQPTRLVRRGDVLNRLPLIEAETDEWFHTINLTSHQTTDAALNDLLAQIILHHQYVETLRANGVKVRLRLYVQSDSAQMSYSLTPETLSRLVATGLPLDVTSLSWGEVGL